MMLDLPEKDFLASVDTYDVFKVKVNEAFNLLVRSESSSSSQGNPAQSSGTSGNPNVSNNTV
jgi:hypothetical protein